MMTILSEFRGTLLSEGANKKMHQPATRTIRVTSLRDQGTERDETQRTPAERLSTMWQLAVDAWAFKEENIAESRLPRHIVSFEGATFPVTRVSDQRCG